MGGKHKISNRTKNNARPSNSSRSAELLSTVLPQFGSFSGIKDLALSAKEDIDPLIDSHFQLALKKITKKDSTTKSKGLQELADLVKNAETDTVKAILQVWSRQYNVLSSDSDNRVREETQKVHHQIAIKVKRDIAPYLKQFMAPWFISQYDTYPPAASCASVAFQDAFPPPKVQKAIIFCQKEILTYIHENLLIQSVETLCGKNFTAEEAEAKYLRLVISCLQGYCLYIEKVPAENIQEAQELNSMIISNSKFWKFAKDKIASVRSAFFKTLTAILQSAAFLIKDKESQVIKTVLNNLEENEPTVLPYVWECVLLVTSSIQGWWKYVNMEKQFLPKLMKILAHAGRGNAAILYPNLLPLLSHLPKETLKEPVPFYANLFENFAAGFKLKSVVASRSESSAVATAFIECLQYVIMNNSSDLDLCRLLIKTHLLSLIEWCLSDKNSCHKAVFNQTSSLVRYLNRADQTDALRSLSDYFFENLENLFGALLLEFPTCGISDLCDSQIEFMQSLKHPPKTLKQGKVKFSCEEVKTANSPMKKHPESVKPLLGTLNRVVISLCDIYIKFIQEKRLKIVLEKLCFLLNNFGAKEVFESTLHKLGETNFIQIYEQILKKWLNDENLRSENVIHLVFLLLGYLNTDEKELILKELLQVLNLEWSISEALADPNIDNPVIRNWLKSKEIGNFFVQVAEKITRNDCQPSLVVLFKLALTENRVGELSLNKDSIAEIITTLTSVSKHQTEHTFALDTCFSLTCYLSTMIYTEHLKLAYGDKLLLCLVQMSCQYGGETDFITSETCWEVASAWQDAAATLFGVLPKDGVQNLIEKIANVIESEFLSCTLTEQDQVEHFADVITSFIKIAYKSVPLDISKIIELFFERNWHHKRQELIKLCQIADYVKNGTLCKPILTCNFVETDALQYLVWTYIKAKTLGSYVADFEDDEYENEEEDTESEKFIILNILDDANSDFLNVLHDCAIGESFLMHFSNCKSYDDFLNYYILLETEFQKIWKKIDIREITNMKHILESYCIESDQFWCNAAYNFFNNFVGEKNKTKEVVESILEKNYGAAVYLTQLCAESIKYDSLPETLKENLVVLRHYLVHKDFSDVEIEQIFNKVRDHKCNSFTDFLKEDMNLATIEKIQNIIDVIRISSTFMKHKYVLLSRQYWDFIVLSLASWASYCLQMMVENYQYQAMLVAVGSLYVNTCELIANLKQEENKEYVDEWEDVLVEEIHFDITKIWLYVAEYVSEKPANLTYLPFLQSFGKVIDFVRPEFIFRENENFPKWTKFFKRACSLLTNSVPTLQMWGYKALLALVPGIIKMDTNSVGSDTPQRKGLIFEQFKEVLKNIQEVVISILSDIKLGEGTCRVKTSTDSFTYTFAYLLLWDVLLILCEKGSAELRYQYADWLKNEDLLQNFLSNLLRLMPAEVLHYSEGKSKEIVEYFAKNPLDGGYCYTTSYDSDSIEKMACYLYRSFLTHLPALARKWWTDLDPRVTQIVDKITSLYVSTFLCTYELNDVLQHQEQFKNMPIKVMPSIREILAVYTVDEAQMELTITLPVNYPLGSPNIDCNKQIVGTTHKQWLLQFRKCVLHQNGRISDGLLLWKSNLDRKFDGIEECYICFAILHTGTYQLPRLSCQTCKKKFHSACLYKWFSTSNKSSCPICRNLF